MLIFGVFFNLICVIALEKVSQTLELRAFCLELKLPVSHQFNIYGFREQGRGKYFYSTVII